MSDDLSAQCGFIDLGSRPLSRIEYEQRGRIYRLEAEVARLREALEDAIYLYVNNAPKTSLVSKLVTELRRLGFSITPNAPITDGVSRPVEVLVSVKTGATTTISGKAMICPDCGAALLHQPRRRA